MPETEEQAGDALKHFQAISVGAVDQAEPGHRHATVDDFQVHPLNTIGRCHPSERPGRSNRLARSDRTLGDDTPFTAWGDQPVGRGDLEQTRPIGTAREIGSFCIPN